MDIKKILKFITSKHFRQSLKSFLLYVAFFGIVILLYISASEYIYNKFGDAMQTREQTSEPTIEQNSKIKISEGPKVLPAPSGPTINESGVTIIGP
ncbi:hypothetical protein HN419_01400 [Candidatus Woesearchaeota archaeon]|jgi:hypothetical protein|nr:hypothetical protein [Candidatus Woesearchaeota archaeon]MBT3537348.1 hypothetical protein [Candidatus Woesearchaeota archaeon]MBT4697383.1 hypothetical protein [Candidatus Woesearchaeota archaeon]MBT4716686.1 hypothetical protein [Candidatus Woesearchaeota archaeon]MBT7106342.1 hypothetical protein [Candidatus Woesearchaeota archaeon]